MRFLAFWAAVAFIQALPQEPDAASQKQAETALRETFKAEYGRKQPGDQRALAQKLAEYSSTLDPKEIASRYVALRESRDLYAKAGDWDLALKKVDQMAKAFAVEAVPAKMAVLSKMAANAQGTEISLIANLYFVLAFEAVTADRFEDAMKCLSLSEGGAKAVKDMALAASIVSLRREAETLRAQFQKAKAPEAAAGEMGRYLCLFKGDWERGLSMLAEIKDESLRTLAQAEMAKMDSVDEKLQAADAWWDWAWREKNISSREKAQSHACALYGRLTGLNTASKTKVDERLRSYEILRLGDRLECVPGIQQRTRGVKIRNEIGDGRSIEGYYFGRPGARSGIPETGPCIYFEIPKSWAGKEGFLEITAECYDLMGIVALNYNERDAAGNEIPKAGGASISLGNSSTWRTLQFKMPAAGCNNAMHGADFRISSTADLYLHRLTIRKVAK